jgi:hypothetical protein
MYKTNQRGQDCEIVTVTLNPGTNPTILSYNASTNNFQRYEYPTVF